MQHCGPGMPVTTKFYSLQKPWQAGRRVVQVKDYILSRHEIPRKSICSALKIDILDNRTSCSSGHRAASP